MESCCKKIFTRPHTPLRAGRIHSAATVEEPLSIEGFLDTALAINHTQGRKPCKHEQSLKHLAGPSNQVDRKNTVADKKTGDNVQEAGRREIRRPCNPICPQTKRQ